MNQTTGETLYRMYRTILDTSGVDEANKWRKEKLNLPQKRMLTEFEKYYVDDAGNIVSVWKREAVEIGG